jgi:hypothetical protein
MRAVKTDESDKFLLHSLRDKQKKTSPVRVLMTCCIPGKDTSGHKGNPSENMNYTTTFN